MIVLGLDPGTIFTGYGVVKKNGSSYQHISSGLIHPGKETGEGFHQKLKFYFDEVTALIEKFKPYAVSLEDIFTGINIKSALKLAHLRGVIILAAVQNSIELFEYSPRTVKLAVTGKGNATKEQVKYMVKILLNLKANEVSKRYDSADALAAAICHINNDISTRSYR